MKVSYIFVKISRQYPNTELQATVYTYTSASNAVVYLLMLRIHTLFVICVYAVVSIMLSWGFKKIGKNGNN